MAELPSKSIKQGLGIMIAVLAVSSFVMGFALCGMACKYSHSGTPTEADDG